MIVFNDIPKQWVCVVHTHRSLGKPAFRNVPWPGTNVMFKVITKFDRHLANLPELQQRRMGRCSQYLAKRK